MLVSDRSPGVILGTLGVWVLLSLVLQLRSHADPDERMYGLMATVVAAALAIAAGGYLAADADAVVVGAVAVAAAMVVRALPVGTAASAVLAVAAGVGAGYAVGGMASEGALVGAGAAVCALIGHRVVATTTRPASSTSRRESRCLWRRRARWSTPWAGYWAEARCLRRGVLRGGGWGPVFPGRLRRGVLCGEGWGPVPPTPAAWGSVR